MITIFTSNRMQLNKKARFAGSCFLQYAFYVINNCSSPLLLDNISQPEVYKLTLHGYDHKLASHGYNRRKIEKNGR
ncbi:hypothetical protein ScPMuIL_004894 [Solemya velum]